MISDGTTTYIMQGGSGLGFSKALCICENDLLHCSVPTARLDADSKGIARFPEHVRIGEQLQWAGSNTYAEYNSGLKIYVQDATNTGSTKSITMTADGGTLHGAWTHEVSFTMSDKRLKTNIEPVGETLKRYLEVTVSDNASASGLLAVPKWDKSTDKDPVLWILDRLKPVSYIMKRNKAAGRRFGFLADDLEEILPDIVHVDPQDEARLKRVHMMDLLSILAAASQRQQQRIEELELRHGDLERQVALLTSRFDAVFTGGGSARV